MKKSLDIDQNTAEEVLDLAKQYLELEDWQLKNHSFVNAKHEATDANVSHPSTWISLQFLDSISECCLRMLRRPEGDLSSRLGLAIYSLLKKSAPEDIVLNGVSIHHNENAFYFCISGSISEDNAQKIVEQNSRSRHR